MASLKLKEDIFLGFRLLNTILIISYLTVFYSRVFQFRSSLKI